MSKAVVFFAEGTEECEALLVVDLLRLLIPSCAMRSNCTFMELKFLLYLCTI